MESLRKTTKIVMMTAGSSFEPMSSWILSSSATCLTRTFGELGMAKSRMHEMYPLMLSFNTALKSEESGQETNFPTSCGFPSWRHVTYKVRCSFQLYDLSLWCTGGVLLRVVHFITREERVSHIFLFVSACQFCLFRDIDLLLLCGFVVAVGY